MKHAFHLLSLLLAFCLLLSVGVMASPEPSGEPSGEASSGEPSGETSLAGTYSDGVNTLIIAEDGTFTMDKTGQNLEGVEFVLTVTGRAEADGTFVIEGLFDGDINLIEMATEEQKAADLASVEAAFAGGKVGGDIAPGTYTDGVNTLIIAEDGTFTMDKTGQNLEGVEFVLTVTGHVEDGGFVIDGLFDGDINLIEMATEEQKANDLASVISAFEG